MRFLKAAYVLILGIAVMLSTSLGHAQDQGGSSGGQSGQPNTVWSDQENHSDTSSAPKTQLDLKDTMNFEECVDFKAKKSGSDCRNACPKGLGLGFIQFDYYEPLALVESVPKPWATLFKDTENYISRAFTKFKDTPFGGDEGVQTIKTSMGNYPQRYFETHVWGISVPTRFLMFFQEMTANPIPSERTTNMLNSLTYEIGIIIAEMMGAGEINSLDDIIRGFINIVANFFTMGGYTYIRLMEAIKAIYDTVKALYDIFTAFMELIKTVQELIAAPLQAAIKALIRLIMGEDCAKQDNTNKTSSSYFNVTDWAADLDGNTTTTIQINSDGSTGNNSGGNGNVNSDDGNNGSGDSAKECKPSEDSLYKKMLKKIKELIKSLKEKFGEIITALQLEKAWKVFANFAKSISQGFKDFTDGWSSEAGGTAKQVGQEASTCSNRDWLCSADRQMSAASTSGGTLEGNPAQNDVKGSSSAISARITELGGKCENGQPVGEWGDRVSKCDSNGLLQRFGESMAALNKMQDIFRSGSVINLMGAAAGSLIPVGLIPSYISEFDRPAWNKGTPNFISVFQSMVASTPFLCGSPEIAATIGMNPLPDSVKKSFCIGIWGPVYPKVGAVPMDDPHKAAAITNFRGFSLAANWGTFPVPFNPKKSSVRFNVDHPFKGKKCYDLGTINPNWESKLANEGGSAALDSMTGGMGSFFTEVGGALDAAAESGMTNVAQGSKTDGYVHTYWKKTRACMSACITGAKWEKIY